MKNFIFGFMTAILLMAVGTCLVVAVNAYNQLFWKVDYLNERIDNLEKVVFNLRGKVEHR